MDQKVTLNNGNTMPILGLGTWKSKPGEVQAAVKYAITEAGYRHIDCALVYGNEEEVGRGIAESIASGKVKREDLFITSKCWNTFHKRESVVKCCKQSLKNLGLEYLDLYLIHWPVAYKQGDDLFPKTADGKMIYAEDIDNVETWQGMEDCVNQGLVKNIGLSNFNSQQTQRILDSCKIKPVMNQVECHPYLNQQELLEFSRARGVELTAYSPLGSGDSPFFDPNVPVLLKDPVIQAIAEKHNKSAAQVLLKFHLQRGIVVIPKSVNPGRITANTQIFDFELTGEEMKTLMSLNKNIRYCSLSFVSDHKDYPFNIPY